jgi:hypothetical protein
MKVRVVISYDFSDEQRAQAAEHDGPGFDFNTGKETTRVDDDAWSRKESDGVYRATRERLKALIRSAGEPRVGNGNYHEVMSIDPSRDIRS